MSALCVCAHNGGLNGNGTIFLHTLGVVCVVQGRHRDADLAQGARETVVEVELIRYSYAPTRWVFCNHLGSQTSRQMGCVRECACTFRHVSCAVRGDAPQI